MNYMALIEIVGVVGLWLLLVWSARLLSTLKSGIAAQKEIIESFKAQSDYIRSVHDTVSRLYDPKELENVVNIRVEKLMQEAKRNDAKSIGFLIRAHYFSLSFIAHTLLYLSDAEIEETIRRMKETEESHYIKEFISDMRKEVLRIRGEAIARILSGGFEAKAGDP
jgi:hypothetical protein